LKLFKKFNQTKKRH